MAALDTNVLVRLCMADDLEQCKRGQAFVQRNGPVFASQLSVLELAWVLGSVYQRPKQRIVQALRALLDNQDLVPEGPAVLESALNRWEASAADFADCFILESIKAQGQAPLATFDRKLGRLPGTVLI
jgi:predicted nucleic-acid-binding protein